MHDPSVGAVTAAGFFGVTFHRENVVLPRHDTALQDTLDFSPAALLAKRSCSANKMLPSRAVSGEMSDLGMFGELRQLL